MAFLLTLVVSLRETQSSDVPTVMWLDNFSKTLARQVPNLSAGVFSSMLWTGLAMKVYDGPHVDMSLKSRQGNIIPAMPLTHKCASTSDMVAYITRTIQCSDGFSKRFDVSLVNRYQINSIPPKVDTDKLKTEHLRKRCSVSRDGLHRLFPFDILSHNIGANIGLMRVIRDSLTELEIEDTRRYHVWLVDINIFNRLIKVTVS
jgi:hypothetical protein